MAIQAQLHPNNLGFPLFGSQDLMIENGYGTVGFGFGFGFNQSGFNSQQKHQLQQQQQEQEQQLEQRLRQFYNDRQRSQNMFIDSNLLVSNSKPNNLNLPSLLNSQSLALQFEKQRQDTDEYIRLQNEKLRIMLEEQRKQQVAMLLKKVERDTLYLLRQKDEEMAQAEKKRVELEDFLRRLEEENQAWRRVAQENEAMVLTLHNTLEQMKERASYCFNNGVAAEDAESCCNGGRGNREIEEEEEEEEGTGENRLRGGEQFTRKMMVCKGCNSRRSCFLFLPCRHLCSCEACEALLQACPVCRMPKKASIETLIF